jgi:hypothetical protein
MPQKKNPKKFGGGRKIELGPFSVYSNLPNSRCPVNKSIQEPEQVVIVWERVTTMPPDLNRLFDWWKWSGLFNVITNKPAWIEERLEILQVILLLSRFLAIVCQIVEDSFQDEDTLTMSWQQKEHKITVSAFNVLH